MSLSTKWPSLSDDAAYIWSWDFVSSSTRTTRVDFSGLPSAAATTRPVTVHRASGFCFGLLSGEAEPCARSAVARPRTAGVKRNCRIGNSQLGKTAKLYPAYRCQYPFAICKFSTNSQADWLLPITAAVEFICVRTLDARGGVLYTFPHARRN